MAHELGGPQLAKKTAERVSLRSGPFTIHDSVYCFPIVTQSCSSIYVVVREWAEDGV